MKSVIEDVRAFHVAGDVPVLEAPQWPAGERIELRAKLLFEEFMELSAALVARDLEATAQESVDLIYVVVGMALEFGIPLDRVWGEVHRANMAKIDPETGRIRRREDGKILKPEGWTPPDISAAMKGVS